jgi:diguanylate cyclase (GGDEF)-like protein
MYAGKILIVDDDAGMRAMLCAVLEAEGYTVVAAEEGRIEEALRLLETESFEAVLLDLSLPDSEGLETVTRVHEHSPDTAIVVLTGAQPGNGLAALRQGAEDYLSKGELDIRSLVRSLRYAVERHRLHASVRELSLRDELTGLYNRRGFYVMAEQQLKVARRSREGCALVFMDLDRLKQINDHFGHHAGDDALRDAATLLAEGLRASDVVARLGGDEFAALLIGVDEAASERAIERLDEHIRAHNRAATQPYPLSLSAGVVWFDPQVTTGIDDVLDQADRAMYERKQRLRKPKSA